MPNECVINNVFVFAQNDLTNKSLQIWMTPPSLPHSQPPPPPPPPHPLTYPQSIFLFCAGVCADKSGGGSSSSSSSSGYL